MIDLFSSMNNIKRTVLLILFICTASSLYSWEYTETSIDLEGRIAMVAKLWKFNPFVEVKGKFHGLSNNIRYTSLMGGTYFKVAPWLKLGAFYRLQFGAIHLEDWRFTAGPPDKHWWIDTRGRAEHVLIFDATPRFLLPWLPGKNWLLPLKIRYIYNISNKLHNMMIRPGLTYVFMEDRKAVLNLSFNYIFYLALNWGTIPLYSHGPYLSALVHVNDWFKIEGRASFRASKYFVNDGASWALDSNLFSFGLGLIFTPNFL